MNEPSTSFVNIAPYYDELMKPVPYEEWVEYYRLLLAVLNRKPRSLLDVACGTGTMTEMLADIGFSMTGIDIAEPMIRRAKEKEEQSLRNIQYHVCDACKFELHKTFDGALSFFDSLNNILDPQDLQRAFRCISDHIEPGGSFVFDLNTPYAFEQKMFDQKQSGKKHKLHYDWVGTYDEDSALLRVDMTFWYEGREFKEVHHQRAYPQQAIMEMLHEAGFYDIHVYSSYTLEKPRRTSDRLHYACLKSDH